jgi:hypothetical protein
MQLFKSQASAQRFLTTHAAHPATLDLPNEPPSLSRRRKCCMGRGDLRGVTKLEGRAPFDLGS